MADDAAERREGSRLARREAESGAFGSIGSG